jgi:hypothetical protein
MKMLFKWLFYCIVLGKMTRKKRLYVFRMDAIFLHIFYLWLIESVDVYPADMEDLILSYLMFSITQITGSYEFMSKSNCTSPSLNPTTLFSIL